MRDDMDRQEYITYALSQIDDDTVWWEIEKELSAHIDDREQYYLDCGYDSETAAKKAMEHMGSPEAAADGFSKVHKKPRIVTVILALLSLLATVIIFYPFWLIFIIGFLEKYVVIGAGILEAIVLLYVIGLSIIGKRRNSCFICFVAIINFTMTYGLYLFGSLFLDDTIDTFCSHIVFKLACLLTLDFDSLSTVGQVSVDSVASYLICLSTVFYVAIFILLILVFISVCMLKRPTYSLKKRQFTGKVFKVQNRMLIFLAATLFVFPPFWSFDKDSDVTVKVPENVDSIIIAQSDTPCSISEIPTEDMMIVSELDGWYFYAEVLGLDNDEASDDNPEYTPKLKNNIEYHSFRKESGNKLTYSVIKTDVSCSVTKKYVYIEFFDRSNPEELITEPITYETAYKYISDNSENWYEVESIGEITAAIDGLNQVEIIIEKSP